MRTGGIRAIAMIATMIGLAQAASAATMIATGSYAGNYSSDSARAALGPGRYRFTLQLTAPADFVGATVAKDTNTNFICADPAAGGGEFSCGGDNVPTIVDFSLVTPLLYQAALDVNAPYTFLSPGDFIVRTETSETCCDFGLEFYNTNAGTYTLSYAAVPEPAGWALTITGMGIVGGALRRRRSTRPMPAIAMA